MSEKLLVIDWQRKYFLEVDAHAETKEELNLTRDCFELACQKAQQFYERLHPYGGGLLDYIHEEIRNEMTEKYKEDEDDDPGTRGEKNMLPTGLNERRS